MPFVLWDDATRAQSEVRVVQKKVCGKDDLVPLFDHVTEFFAKERDVFFGGLMGSAFQSGNFLAMIPRARVHGCRNSMLFVVSKQVPGVMQQVLHGTPVATGVAATGVKVRPGG